MKTYNAAWILAAALSIPAFNAATAQETSWQAGTGSWIDPANWTSGVPTASVDALIDNGGTAQVQVAWPFAVARDVYVGKSPFDTPSFIELTSGGRLDSRVVYLGHEAGAHGAALIQGWGSFWTSWTFTVGREGTGELSIVNNGRLASASGIIGDLAGSHGTAIVSGSGSTWLCGSGQSASHSMTVGRHGTGTLIVENGGFVHNTFGYIGSQAGSAGSVTVTGAGSEWRNTGLYIGSAEGIGTLSITDGGLVSNTDAYIRQGAVTVSGPGSLWRSTHTLAVGHFGASGTLIIENGGQAINDSGTTVGTFIGNMAGSEGAATVTGAGSSWINRHFYLGYEAGGVLAVEDGGYLSSFTTYLGYNAGVYGEATLTGSTSAWSSRSVFVGYGGTGELTIADGATMEGLSVTSGSMVFLSPIYIGHSSGAQGVATVTGSGSSWTNPGGSYVGYEGAGTLAIEHGGTMSGLYGIIGYAAGSQGAVTVDGSGSSWSLDADLFVGLGGAGTLTVSGGAAVTAGALYASLGNLYGDGTITANGGVYDATIAFDAVHGTQSVIAFGSGGQLHLNPDSSSVLGVGYKNAGAIAISDGLHVSSETGILGYHAGSHGEATLSGAGSQWTIATTLFAGREGAGTLTVENGARLSTVEGHLGFDAGAHGTAVITGSGSQWTNADKLYVGYTGTGALTIEDGGLVTANYNYIGFATGAQGEVTVIGVGSRWTNPNHIYVGSDGEGALTIADGGLVSNAGSLIGVNAAGQGVAVVTGVGSAWTNSLNLYAGFRGAGSLTVEDGATVSSQNGYLGYQGTASNGEAAITGAGSIWTQTLDLFVGREGSGLLTIADGGRVTTNRHGYIGWQSGSSGEVAVTGTGSAWTIGNDLFVGRDGSGTLALADGGQVTSARGYLGFAAGGWGEVSIDGSGSAWTVGSFFNVPRGAVSIAAGGQLFSGTSDIGADSSVTISGPGSVWTNTGEFKLGQGTLAVSDGGLLSTGTLFASLENVHGNGAISAQGVVIDANLVFNSASGPQLTVPFGEGGQLTIDASGGVGGLGLGYQSTGTLTIAEGVQVASLYGTLGETTGTHGAATVTGIGSRWTTQKGILVGNYGDGTLLIEKGGQVVSGEAFSIARRSMSQSAVTVTGSGSRLTVDAWLRVGHYGDGSLLISDGGQVFNTVARIADWASATGSVTVTGSGSRWTNSEWLSIGYSGPASLVISDGGYVSNTLAGVSRSSEVLVTGFGSRWVNSNNLGVGGSLTVENGGQVSSRNASVSSSSGPGAIATVTGIGSSWTNTLSFSVGGEHSGTVYVTDGGEVFTATTYIAQGSSYHGAIEVSGAGSAWNSSSDFFIGYFGNSAGTLNVTDGGQVSVTNLYLGHAATSSATLTVADGGQVSATTLYGTIADLHGNGAIVVQGAVLDDEFIFDTPGASQMIVPFGAGGQLAINTFAQGVLGSGYRSAGTMTVANGAEITSGSGVLGRQLGSNGTATVTGPGSAWTAQSFMRIGQGGSGTLNVEQGGQVTNNEAILGDESGSSGVALVTGAGSKWTAGSTMHVGLSGSGTLNVENGGQVTNKDAFLGDELGSSGVATVTGAGSKWTNTDLTVGRLGAGSLTITDGGQVQNRLAYVAGRANAQSTVLVTGAGSEWINTSGIFLGHIGRGVLTIADGGRMTNMGSILGNTGGSQGTATITGGGSLWTNQTSVYVGYNGAGTITLADGGQLHNANGYLGHFTGAQGAITVDGPGSAWISGGSVYVGGRESVFGGSGTITVRNGGTVDVHNTLKLWTSSIVNLQGGTLRAAIIDRQPGNQFNFTGGTLETGEFRGFLFNSGGTLSPGPALGELLITGGYTQTPAGRLLMELGGNETGQYDTLTVAGHANLAGTFEAALVDSFSPQPGDVFDLLSFGSYGGQFATIALPALSPGLVWDTSNLYTGGTLATQVLLGDFNGDGVLSGLDIPAFKTALADPDAWAAANPSHLHPNLLGDFNGDGTFSGLDIPAFKTALAVAGAAAVPEPATLALLGLALAGALARRRAGR